MISRKIVLGALFLLPSVAVAQISANVNLSGIAFPDVVCTNGISTRVDVPGAIATSCTSLGGRLNASGSASNFGGILRSATSVSLAPGSSLGAVTASAEAEWSDLLRFTVAPGSAAAARVQLRFLLSGSMGGVNVNTSQTFFYLSTGGGVLPVQKTNTTAGGGGIIPFQSFSEVVNWDMNVLNKNFAFFDLTMNTTVRGVTGPSLSDGFSDFSHTMGLTQVSFFDANNNDISSNVTYTFDNNMQFLPSTVAPEPGTWAMMLSGLAMVGAFARRRVRR